MALKDKLMTLEDFKAVRDVDVASNNKQFTDIKADLGDVRNNIFSVSVNLFDKSEIETGILTVAGSVSTSLSQYSTSDFIPVSYGDTISIQDNDKVSQDRYYICEYNENREFVGTRQEVVVAINVTHGTYAIINSSAKYIRVSYIPQSTPTNGLMIFIGGMAVERYQAFDALYVLDSFTKQIKTHVAVNISSGVLNVITKYTNTTDLCVTFGKHGANNLPDFWKLGTISNTDVYPTPYIDDVAVFKTIATDIHSPFIIKAINNIDGDLPNSAHFTGGNHNYNNNAVQGYTTTAVCDSLKYYVDDIELTSYEGYAHTVKAVWVNRVQATNTKKSDGSGRYVLQEKHVLEYINGKWESYVEFMPLEDIAIQTYYGFQWIVDSTFPNIRYIGATNRGLCTNANTYSSGDNKVNGMRLYGTEHKVDIMLDTTLDLGDRKYYSGTSGAFNATVKAYFYLISGLSNAVANNLYCAKATYKFSHA